jgi:bacteriocin biosynthesis cyclodehydratase domain-containing protein
MEKPKIKNYLDIVPMGHDRIQVRSSESVSVLRGQTVEGVFKHLLPLLDGNNTVEEIIVKLDSLASEDVVRGALDRLADSMIIEDAEPAGDEAITAERARYSRQLTFFAATNELGAELEFQKALKEGSLLIVGDGDLARALVAETGLAGVGKIRAVNLPDDNSLRAVNELVSIECIGARLDDLKPLEDALGSGPQSALAVALDRPEPALIGPINEITLRFNVPLLLVQLNGTEGIVGPFVVPGKTACLLCHHLRTTRNLDFYDEYLAWERWARADGKNVRGAVGTLGSFTSVVAGLAATEIIRRISYFYEPELYGKFLTVNALTYEVISHQLLRVPRCPGCSKAKNLSLEMPWLEKR